ncbi:hypothetical protein FB451DRAFT_1175195 [Mycena latifolia]|nr:hypothetical protein FB451DRAFT_1175195 [Mycena latifolia]
MEPARTVGTPKLDANPVDVTVAQTEATKADAPAPKAAKLHCMSCHKNYDPTKNGRKSCHIKHEEENVESYPNLENIDWGYTYTLRCCGTSQECDGNDGSYERWVPRMCHVGPHTTVSSSKSKNYGGGMECGRCYGSGPDSEESSSDS